MLLKKDKSMYFNKNALSKFMTYNIFPPVINTLFVCNGTHFNATCYLLPCTHKGY